MKSYFSRFGKVLKIKQVKDRRGDKTGKGYLKFFDKKSVEKVFDKGRSHHVLDFKLQISRRNISRRATISSRDDHNNYKSDDSGKIITFTFHCLRFYVKLFSFRCL